MRAAAEGVTPAACNKRGIGHKHNDRRNSSSGGIPLGGFANGLAPAPDGRSQQLPHPLRHS
jgi:hypothetical protein